MRRPIDRIEVPIGGEFTLKDGTVIICEEDKGHVTISHCYGCPLMFGRKKPEYGMSCGDFQCGENFRSDEKETHFKLK